jgi:hypothetical protein
MKIAVYLNWQNKMFFKGVVAIAKLVFLELIS